MELPKFKSQGGTDMGGAYVSAARISAPEKIRANTRSYTPEVSVSQAYNDAGAATGMDQIIAIGSQVLDYAVKVDNADQDMSLKAAQAEYKNHMSNWYSDFEATAMEVNEKTGKANWESFADDFARASEQGKKMYRDKYSFSGKEREMEWDLNTKSADQTYDNHVTAFTSKAKGARAEVSWKIGIKSAKSLEEVRTINAKAVASGVILPETGAEEERVFLINQRFRVGMQGAESMSIEEAQGQQRDMALNLSDNARDFTPTQRKALASAAAARVDNVHRQNLDQAYVAGGEAAAMGYIRGLDMSGVAGSYAYDDADHDGIISRLKTAYNVKKAAADDMKDTQGINSAVANFFKGDGASDENTYIVVSEEKKAKDKIDEISGKVIEEAGLNSEAGAHLMMRGAQTRRMPDPVLRAAGFKLFNEANPRELSGTVHMMAAAEKMNPHAWDGLNAAEKERYEFIKARQHSGMMNVTDENSIDEMNKDYKQLKSQPDMVKRRRDDATNLLKSTFTAGDVKGKSASERFHAQANDKNVLDLRTSENWIRDGIEGNMEAIGLYEQNYIKYYEMTGSDEGADRMAFDATRKIFSDEYFGDDGKAVMEMNGPSKILGITDQGLVNRQHDTIMEQVNEQRKTNNQPPITAENTRRVYVGKRTNPETKKDEESWLLIDKAYQPVMRGNKYTFAYYSATDPEKVKADRVSHQLTTYEGIRSRVDSAVAENSYLMPMNGSQLLFENSMLPARRHTGQDTGNRPQTPDEFNRYNASEWEDMDGAERVDSNTLFHQVHTKLMEMQQLEAAKAEQEFDYESADYHVRHYLNGLGYKSMTAEGDFNPPPEMH